jgi:hypothetical protein
MYEMRKCGIEPKKLLRTFGWSMLAVLRTFGGLVGHYVTE